MSSTNAIRISHLLFIFIIIVGNFQFNLDFTNHLFRSITYILILNIIAYWILILLLQLISIEILGCKMYKNDAVNTIFTDYNNIFHFFKNMTKFFLNI